MNANLMTQSYGISFSSNPYTSSLELKLAICFKCDSLSILTVRGTLIKDSGSVGDHDLLTSNVLYRKSEVVFNTERYEKSQHQI